MPENYIQIQIQKFQFRFEYSIEPTSIYLTNSLANYLGIIETQLQQICQNPKNIQTNVNMHINIKNNDTQENIQEYIEIITLNHLLKNINSLFISTYRFVEFQNIFSISFPSLSLSINPIPFHTAIFEFEKFTYKNTPLYIEKMLTTLLHILKWQQTQGSCIIRISYIFYRPLVEILFILSSLYEQIFILKPSTNIPNDIKYILCKNFLSTNQTHQNMIEIIEAELAAPPSQQYLTQILEHPVPYLFCNKLEEINVIFGQQELETSQHIINLSRNKSLRYSPVS